MEEGWHIGVVVPAKNEAKFIRKVIETMPEDVDCIVVVNDGSTDATSQEIKAAQCQAKLIEINLDGQGVGAAIDAGHQAMLEQFDGPFVSVVMAGDGQMDPDDLRTIIAPVIAGQADHVKGNRFAHSAGTDNMPVQRKIASKVLSIATTLAAGQPIHDPQCGYTATSHEVLKEWNWNRSWKGYGYPNFWLIQLAKGGWRVLEVPVKSVYGAETSGIKRFKFFASVGTMMAIEHHRRNFGWLFNRNVTPHTLFAFIAYAIGWISLLPGISTDLERELLNRGLHPVMLTLVAWIVAHFFDRTATAMVQELKLNAKARQAKEA
jgi:glycosyltransferase involved in cell wall biosynthesis